MADHPITFGDGAAYERYMGTWSRLAGDVFLDWLAPPPALRWVDVGCGNGAFTQLLVDRCAPSEVQGIDPSEGQLAYALDRNTAGMADFRQGDAMDLPFPEGQFDAAVMALVIFFVPDPAKGSLRWCEWRARGARWRPTFGITESEIELLRSTGSGVSYNPLASVWKGDRVAPALAFASRGVRFGIGSDGTRLDAFRLLETAEACQRHASGMSQADFSCGAAWTWIDAATRGSADVCGLGGLTGDLREGMCADFLVLDKQRPEVLPSWDFEWELVRFCSRDQINAVVVDGKPVMANGQPLGWSMQDFLEQNLPLAIAKVDAAPIDRRHGPSAAHRKQAMFGDPAFD